MAMKCDNCSKGIMWGHAVSHSKRRTNRIFKPNIQKKRVTVNGREVRVKLCTNCIKLFKKRAMDAKKAAEAAAQTA